MYRRRAVPLIDSATMCGVTNKHSMYLDVAGAGVSEECGEVVVGRQVQQVAARAVLAQHLLHLVCTPKAHRYTHVEVECQEKEGAMQQVH
jgi:hypothetical protein